MKHTFPEDEHTIYSFCEEMMREHPALFDAKGLVLITPLEKVRLIKNIIDGFSSDNPLKRYRGDVYAALHPLAHLFSQIKSGQESATAEFHTYQQMLLAAGKCDTDDVISALQQTPELLSKYKEQLQYATGEPREEEPPGSRHTLNILRYIAAEQEIPASGEDLLFKLMHDAHFQIPPVEAAKICRQAADQKTTIRAYLLQPRIPSLFSTGPHENALHLSSLLEKWMKLPFPELLEALPQSEVLKEEIRRNPDLTLSALMESVDLAEERPSIAQQGMAPEIEKMDRLFIDPLLKDFAMSATILNNYLRCPLAFFYQQLIKVPMGRQENLAFGSAAHYALEKLFQKMQLTDVFPSRETFLQDFDTYMLNNRAAFTTEAFERRMEYGHRTLSSYYTRYIHEWNPIVSVERTFRNISVNGVPVKGKIDKLEFDGKRVNIVDYKTGDYERTKRDWKKFAPPEEKLPRGGDYWRQGVFYKILLDNYKQKDWQVVSTEFDFIEPGRNGEYFKEKINITPADITTVTQQITESWERIQQRDFYTGCGKPYCEWCNFVKNNHLQVALHTLAASEEEE
jgi:hypothetical protein